MLNKINKINKFLLFLIFSMLFINPALAKDYIEGDVLVIFKGEEGTKVKAASLMGMGREALRAASIASEKGAWVKNTYANLSEAGNSVFALIHSDILSTDKLISELLSRPDVVAASPNYVFKTAVMPDDTATPDNNSGLWGLSATGAVDVWNENITGNTDVYVAIIDTGIDYTHDDLADNIDMNLSKNFVSGVSTFMDDNGHGTHVAGTIGAIGNNKYGLVGMNWNVKIIALKAMDEDGNGTASDVVSALDYIRGLLNSNKSMNLAAINMSIEAYVAAKPADISKKSEPLWLAMKLIDLTNRSNMIVAAGNSGITVGEPSSAGKYVYPASFTGLYNMLSVGAVSSDFNLTSFSNKNASINAPGINILSTYPESLGGSTLSDGAAVDTKRGTSMAAPHVAGAIALLKSYNSALTASQVTTVMLNSGKETLKSVSAESDLNSLLNVADAVEYVDNSDNASIIASAASLPDAYDDEPDDDDSGGGSSGSSGCESFDFSYLIFIVMMILLKIIEIEIRKDEYEYKKNKRNKYKNDEK